MWSLDMTRPQSFAAMTGPTAAVSRRQIVKLSAGGTLAVTILQACPWAVRAEAQPPQTKDIPQFEGEFLADDTARSSVALDYGRDVNRMPRAVVRPRSVEDIVRVVAHANQHGIKVAVRGQAHSLSGQALVADGIVIDSSSLRTVEYKADDAIDAQAGALWGDIAKGALGIGHLPPVMPDALMLSVGGTLSVGGIGETSYRFGAQVDHVVELDVVTGKGDFITCSASSEPELFAMVLAGLGQCGIIVRARLGVAKAARGVVTQTLGYADLATFLSDQARLTADTSVDLLNGRLTRNLQGRWQYELTIGRFIDNVDQADNALDWTAKLRHTSASAPIKYEIWKYLDRRTASVAAGKAKLTPNPSLIVTLPAEATERFINELLTSPEQSAGIWFFEVSPKIPSLHGRPLQKMPMAAVAYELRMQRRASATGASDHVAMLAANQRLAGEALEQGGKVYPPFAPLLESARWQQHYGQATWERFRAAKLRFDPNNVLNPGVGIF
jgi:cytokinin dehydrogenase